MAESTKSAKPKAKAPKPVNPMERVTIRLPKKKGQPSLFVNVNQYNALIPRGVEVSVPLYVKKHIDEMLAQDEDTMDMIEGLKEEYQQAIKNL